VKNEKTLQQRLADRTIRNPPALIYILLGYLWRIMYLKRLNVHFHYEVDIGRFRKSPYIVVSNHASRLDYIYTGAAFLPQRLNYVAGYNEFFRSHLAFVFRLLQVIPKRNFIPDIYAAKSILNIIKGGGKVIVFPEGMSSIGGSNQPCALGGGNLLKRCRVPVLRVRIRGGYLTNTKYCLDERPGRVDVFIDQLFTPEALDALSEEEVQLRLDEAIHQDDYAWNKVERVRFEGRGNMAHHLHHLLYWCPRCGREFTMKGEGNSIRCSSCGNGATLDDYYDLVAFDDGCSVPATPRAWFDLERKKIAREVLEADFSLKEQVSLGVLPKHEYLKDQKTSEIVGEGELSLNRGGLHYRGTREGEPFSLDLTTDQVPTFGMCTDVSRFYTFHKGEFLEFYPRGETTAKWLLATEEMHRANGGKWKNFPEPAMGEAGA
jgi:1-acyl-sn-glycerol-3-phosphate acyltransferase